MKRLLSLQTSRLELVAQTPEMAKAANEAPDRLSSLLQAVVIESWPPEALEDVKGLFADILDVNPDWVGWWCWYVISVEGERTLIGAVGFDGPPAKGRCALGYSIVPEYENRGLTTEACKTLLEWGFSHSDLEEVHAETHETNRRSLRVMQKLGMSYEGRGSESGTVRYRISRTDRSRVATW